MSEISLPEDNPFMKALMALSEQVIADSDNSKTVLFTPERKAIAIDMRAVKEVSNELAMKTEELDDFCKFHATYSLSTFLEAFTSEGKTPSIGQFQSICSGLLMQGVLVGAKYNRDKAIELENLVEGDK